MSTRPRRTSSPGFIDRTFARLYGWLWYALPRAFRQEYRDVALVDLERMTTDRRSRGRPLAMARLRTLAQLAGSAVTLRLHPPGLRPDLPQRADGGARRMTSIRDDFAEAYRSLRHRPGYAFLAIAILALGVGGSAAVFSFLDGILLEPLPYTDAHRLGVIWTWDEARNLPDGSSYANTADWSARSRSLQSLALYYRTAFTDYTLRSGDRPRRIHVGLVSANMFEVLGVAPRLGRTFSNQEEADGEAVLLVGERFWLQELGGDPEVLGRSVTLDEGEYRIVGVMPASLAFPEPHTELWALATNATGGPARERTRRADAMVVVARLRDGVDFADAQRDLDIVTAELAAEYPETNTDMGARIRPLLHEITGASMPRNLWMLFGATVLVLLVAATNVAHLALARGAARAREFAVRSALGAGGRRLARQQLAEAILLALGATALGTAIAYGSSFGLLRLAPADMPRLDGVGIDLGILLGALGATLALGLGFGLAPAWSAARSDPSAAMREGVRGSESSARRRAREVLVVAQVATATVLLAGSGVLLGSLAVAQSEGAGFDTDSLVRGRIDLPGDLYPERADARDFYGRLTAELRAHPAVRSVGIIQSLLVQRIPDMEAHPDGRTLDVRRLTPTTSDAVWPGFFEAIGSPILSGRAFEETDALAEDWNRRYIINETAASTYWPGEDPVGKTFRWAPDAERVNRVVGVVTDMKRRRLDQPPVAQFFIPAVFHSADVLLATPTPNEALAALGDVVRRLDAAVPISGLTVVGEVFGASLAPRRFQLVLLLGFALLSAVLASAGLFGLLVGGVQQRRRELGLRMALGAQPRRLVRAVVGRALVLTGVGGALGVAAFVGARGVIAGVVYGVTPEDPRMLVVVVGMLLGVAFLASAVPARHVLTIRSTESLDDG